MAIRGLFQKAGVKYKTNEEAMSAPEFVRVVKELAANSGGVAPAPKAGRLGSSKSIPARQVTLAKTFKYCSGIFDLSELGLF